MLVVVLLVALGVAAAFQPQRSLTTKRYDGYKVLTVMPENQQALKLMRDMFIEDTNLDFWEEPSRVGAQTTFMVPPEHLQRVESQLNANNVHYAEHVSNVQDVLTPMWNSIDSRQLKSGGKLVFDLNDFNTLDDIYTWLDQLVSSCRSGLTCEVYSAGNSYEGRPINIFKISKSGAGRKAYWVDATIHAREWLATATAVNLINHLATSTDADAVRLTDAYDWYLMPVMNPDGYEYTWTNDRYWRKNRRPNTGSICSGTDLNRNFDFRWGNDGVSHAACSDIYCGPNGGSEPETAAVSAELVRLGPTLGASVTMHSYGNMWMFPWGNTVNYAGAQCDFADDDADMMVVADATADAIESTYNTRWSRGNSCDVIYATTGGTDDYSKGVAGVKYAFCPELRGNDFVVNANQIPLSFNEIWNGIVAMCDTINA